MRHRMTLMAVVVAFALLPGVASADQPIVTSMSPSSADAAGGVLIVIYGTGFANGATVRFGTTPSSAVTVAGTTALIVNVPPGVAGSTQTVVVTNPDGTTAVAPMAFTYNAPAMTVTAVSPTTGAVSGGTLVTINGTEFQPGATVTFGTTPGTNVTVINSTTLTVLSPAGAFGSAGSVTVTNPNGATALAPSLFTFGGGSSAGTQPSISSVSPNSGSAAGGTTVTITGAGFVPGVTVSFGSAPAVGVTVVSATQITLTTPSGSVGSVPVTVTSPAGMFGGISNGFTYLVATPQLTAVSPADGPLAGGTPVVLTGSGFVVGATVTIGGQPARNVAVSSPTTITAVTPPGVSGAAVVLVTNPGGLITGLATGFTYSTTAATGLVVTGVSPSSGSMTGGTLVTITGQGFASGAIVTVGGVPATNVTVLGPTQILASTPAVSASGPATVVVTVNNIGSTLTGAFTYSAGAGTTTTTTTPPATQGTALTPGTSGLFVFRGGTNAQLVAASGCPSSRVVLWATDAKGQWVGYIPTAPAVINVSWEALFPAGIPAGTPVYARCS